MKTYKKKPRPTKQELDAIIKYLREGFKLRKRILKEYVETKDIPPDLEYFDMVIKELKQQIKEIN